MAPPRILVVCTANQCRSPLAEGLLRSLLEERGIEAIVDSAGTSSALAGSGAPATPDAVEVAARRGADIATHRSRHVGDVDASGADLVIGMERPHVLGAVVDGGARPQSSFTLVELARRAATTPRRPGEDLAAWAARLSAGRSLAELSSLAGADADGIADPIGRSRRVYEDTAERIDALLRLVLDQAFPPGSTGGEPGLEREEVRR